MKDSVRRFQGTLRAIKDHDTDYESRYLLVWTALTQALDLGYVGGVRIDPADPEWPVVYIELPTGQVSWHMPQYAQAWDGHTTQEKYRRIQQYMNTANRAG